MNVLISYLALIAPTWAAAGGTGFSSLWKSTWRNITIPRDLPVQGTVPDWLHGSLFRNAGGAFESAERNVTFAFDGIPKIFKFHISGGRVAYQERFLSTGYYGYIQDKGDIPKVPLMGATVPPFPITGAPSATAGDVDNVQVFHLKGDDRTAFALTDSTMTSTFDMDTLAGSGHLPVNDSVKEGLIQLSCAHPQYDPSSDGKALLSFASTFFGGGSLIGHHEIQVYRMGLDHVRHAFGSVTIPYAPFIHSFSVTKTKMILVVYPLGFDVKCVLLFSPMIGCLSCPRDRHATIFVFDLASTEKKTKPVATIEAPYHMVMHHVNAYDEAGGDRVVFDVSAQDSCDTLFAGPSGMHANLEAMRNKSARDQVQHWGTLRTYEVDLKTPSKPSLTWSDHTLLDSEGYVYQMDFPFPNPNFAFQKHQYIWALSSYARNSSSYEDWAVLKIDRLSTGKGAVNTKVWYKKGHYPQEPVFVPKPGGVEDEGVLLVQVTDGFQDRGYLLILDAASMTEIASASLQAGEHLPYSQHGRWFDAAPTATLVV